MLGVVGFGSSISPLFTGPSFSSTNEFLVGWGPFTVLPWIPPPHVRALPGSTNFVGTNAQAHLLVMSLNVAKCNLGKVNLKAMLASSFPSYTGGGPMPLAGAPRDLCAVACLKFFAKCCCNSLLLFFACLSVLWFFPIPPSLPLEVWAR